MKKIKYGNGEPCNHKGCLHHISHPCDGCGRIGGNGIVYCENWGSEYEAMKFLASIGWRELK